MRRRDLLVAAGLGGGLRFATQAKAQAQAQAQAQATAATAAGAQGRLLFGFAPGGIGSTLGQALTRLLAVRHPELAYQLEHVTAAASARSVEIVKHAAPDGRTLVQVQSAQVSLMPQLLGRLPYDPLTDLQPVATIGSYSWAFTVGPAVPPNVKRMRDYLQWVREHPEWRNYGVALYGSQGHLSGLLTARELGAAIRPIAYAGTGPLVKDLASQSLAAGYVIIGNGTELFANGTLRALAVMGRERWHTMPDVPTFEEEQVPGVPVPGWYAWFAPAATDPDRLQPLRAAVQDVLSSPSGQALLDTLQLKPLALLPEQIRDRIRQEQAYFGQVARDLRIGRHS